MVPLLLVTAAVGASCIGIPCGMWTPSDSGVGWLPWALGALGVFAVCFAIFERNPRVDFKASAKANAMVLLFGPVGSRIGYGLLGGAFLGLGIGLLAA
jgi:hypothetical protein